MTISKSLYVSNAYYIYRDDGREIEIRIIAGRVHTLYGKLTNAEIEYITKNILQK